VIEINSTYEPHAIQARWHASPATQKLFLGGIGSGKTVAGIHEFFWNILENVGTNAILAAPTFPMLRDVLLVEWHNWIPRECFTFHKSDQRIELWTKQQIFCRSGTEPDRSRGPTVGTVYLDEAAMLRTPEFWRILKGRIRDPRAKQPKIIATTTPCGLNWLIKEFQRSGFMCRARTKDNPYLPADFEADLRLAYGDEYAAQELDAEIVELGGIAWPIHKNIHCQFTVDQMRGKCKDFFAGIDWGFTAPAVIIVGGLSNDRTWFLVEEFYKKGMLREDIARKAAELGSKWNVREWYSDHDPEGMQWMKRLGLNVKHAEKSAPQGGQLATIAGVQHVRSLLAVRGDGLPRMFIDADMTNWLNEQSGYRFPFGQERPIGDNGDHAMDATRYMIYTHDLKYAEPFEFQRSGKTSRYEGQANA